MSFLEKSDQKSFSSKLQANKKEIENIIVLINNIISECSEEKIKEKIIRAKELAKKSLSQISLGIKNLDEETKGEFELNSLNPIIEGKRKIEVSRQKMFEIYNKKKFYDKIPNWIEEAGRVNDDFLSINENMKDLIEEIERNIN